MQQIILLRGWTTKENYKNYYGFLQKREINPYEEKTLKWSETLWKKLWDNFEVLEIQRPNKDFADYKARKIFFEKYLPYIKQWAIFIGHSLWWTFFLKYMEENIEVLQKFKKSFLVAPACKDSKNEVLWSFSIDTNFTNLINFQDKIEIFWSKDDFVVPFEEIQTLQKVLPKVKYHIFENRWHFPQENFKELVEEIREIKALL